MGAGAAWTPPANPDPQAILNEARIDTLAGRYEDALAKHLWFHREALKHQPSQYGVRLSFAMGFWLDLGRSYPPALAALKAERDASVARVRGGQAQRNDFADLSTINRYLKEEAATAELFVWLDANNPRLARDSYPRAERSLIDAKQYSLCGKYLDPQGQTKRMLDLYRQHLELAKDPAFKTGRLEDFGRRSLTNSASTLVALLALNNRGAEADQVVDAVLKTWPDDGLRSELAKAKKGAVPPRWP